MHVWAFHHRFFDCYTLAKVAQMCRYLRPEFYDYISSLSPSSLLYLFFISLSLFELCSLRQQVGVPHV